MMAQADGENPDRDLVRRRRQIWLILAVAVAGLMGWAAWNAALRSGRMSVAVTPLDTRAVATGAEIKQVVEITALDPAGKVRGVVLEKETETQYRRTATVLVVNQDAGTHIVMGGPADVRVGAVMHVSGLLRDDASVDARKLVILSGMVQIGAAPDPRP
jgi:hypothetical protein